MTSPTAPVISSTGISAPTYATIYNYLITQYQAIFGADVYLGNDSQDVQFIGVIAQAISDANSAAVAVYNSFSPTTAQGTGLSSVVAINGLQRLVATSSTATIVVGGVSGTVITNGVVLDSNGVAWGLPSSVTIPNSGLTTQTVTCETVGAITIGSGALTIQNPSFGWQTATTPTQVTTGTAVETDAALRVRRAASVALPSLTVFEGIVATLENLAGTTRVFGVENNTGGTSGSPTVYPYQVPANSLCFIVESSASQTAIFNAIFEKITPGIPTYGVPVAQFLGYITTVGAVGTLHITSFTSGTVAIGQTIQYAGIQNNVIISGGSGSTWNLSGYPAAIGSNSSPVSMWSGAFIARQVTDANDSQRYLVYNPPSEQYVNVSLTIVTGSTYPTATPTAISAALSSYLSTLEIGSNISYFGLIPIVALSGNSTYAGTYEVTGLSIGTTSTTAYCYSSGTTLTVNSVISGTITIGQQIFYTGCTQAITVSGGGGSSWTLSSAPSPAISSPTLVSFSTMQTSDIQLNFNQAPNLGTLVIV